MLALTKRLSPFFIRNSVSSALDTEFRMKNGESLFVSASMGAATAPTDATTVHGGFF